MQVASKDNVMASKYLRPLDLPEILKMTFVFLDGKSLFACAQVNSLWANDLLWTNPPNFALANLLASGRAQVYADKTSRLESLPCIKSKDSRFLQAYSHLSFPRLTKLSLALEDVEWLPQYLQPSLRVFKMECFTSEANRDDRDVNQIYMQLSTRCPHLREVIIGNVGLTVDGLLRFLETMPSIRNIKLRSYELVTMNLMQYLAARPNLERLHIPGAISASLAAKIGWASESPFADLRTLCCYVKEDALISKHMTKLVVLEISLHGPSSNILSTASSCPALKSLQVWVFDSRSMIVGADLVYLAERCPKLERVSLLAIGHRDRHKRDGWSTKGGIDGSIIHDNDVYHFTYLLPALKEFSLDARGALSFRSLHHLGRNCHNLRTCRLSGCTFDLSELHESDISGSPTGNVAALRPVAPSRATQSVPSHTVSQMDTDQTKQFVDDYLSSNASKLLEHAEITHKSPVQESPSLFPNLHELEVNKLSNSRDDTIPELLTLLQREAPKLERFRVQSEAEFGREVALAFRLIQRERHTVHKPPKTAYNADLDEKDEIAFWGS